jgi:hypothetical protein
VLTKIEQRKAFQQEDSATLAAAQSAIDQASKILSGLEAIVSQMIDLEEFNELLDMVRTMIDEQEKLIIDTKKEQRKEALELLK